MSSVSDQLDYTAVDYRNLFFSRISQKADGYQYQYQYCSVPVHFVATRLSLSSYRPPWPWKGKTIHLHTQPLYHKHMSVAVLFLFFFGLNGNKAILKKNIENGENWYHERKIPCITGKASCKINSLFYFNDCLPFCSLFGFVFVFIDILYIDIKSSSRSMLI